MQKLIKVFDRFDVSAVLDLFAATAYIAIRKIHIGEEASEIQELLKSTIEGIIEVAIQLASNFNTFGKSDQEEKQLSAW